MRKLGICIMLISALSSCEPEHTKDYLTFAGKLENTQDSLLIINGSGLRKRIKIQKNGSFNDTIRVSKSGLYSLFNQRNQRAIVYLNNGYHLKLTGDARNFFKSFRYDGDNEGADSNNLLVDRFNFGQTAGSARGFMVLEKQAFLDRVDYFKNGMDSIASLYDNANEKMLKDSDDQNNKFFTTMVDNYDRMHETIKRQIAAEEKLQKGKPAPDFSNYENFKGGTKSLKDFRGKYVYIDVWATWCRPCIAQIPYLKQLEEEYKDKNIVFLSISTDDDRRSNGSWEKAHDKWTKMVKDKNLSGVQLWAGKDDARFSQEYMISGIPRFILIDPQGNIVESNAQRPTNPSIRQIFDALPGI
ncbi:MAG: TlpA disulfide reductase family protein [Flavobacteriaceae bacterium]